MNRKKMVMLTISSVSLLVAISFFPVLAISPNEVLGKDAPSPYTSDLPFNNIFSLLLFYILNFLKDNNNHAPGVPYDAAPADGAVDVSVMTTLSWKCDDADGDELVYHVYLGSDEAGGMELVYEGKSNSVDVSLSYGTTYSWKVIADDGEKSTSGNVWHFTTEEYVAPVPPGPDNESNYGWTIMVYLDGDNNMDDYAQMELNEIKSVHINGNVTVVILYDGYGNGNSHFYVAENNSFEEIPLGEVNASWIGEVNMGDSRTLRDFVNYSMANYPAKNYMLELWSHGNGWMGICQDSSSGDRLTMKKVKNALSESCGAHNKKIDVVVYTACGMGEIENAYAIKDYADYFISSEESFFATGLPHADIIENAVNNSSISPQKMSEMIVNEFSTYYQSAKSATLSAVNLSNLDNLIHTLDEFSQNLISNLETNKTEIGDAYNETESFDGIGIIDLYDFACKIQESFNTGTELYNSAQRIMENVTKATVSEWHGSNHQNAHGIGIYLPSPERYVDLYEDTCFAAYTHWDEFLSTFYSI